MHLQCPLLLIFSWFGRWIVAAQDRYMEIINVFLLSSLLYKCYKLELGVIISLSCPINQYIVQCESGFHSAAVKMCASWKKNGKRKSICPLRNFFNTFSVEDVVKDPPEWKIVIEMRNKNFSSFYSKYFQDREREVFDLGFLFIGSISLTNRRAQHFPFHIVHHLYTIQFSQSSSLLLALRWLIERGVLVFSLLLKTNWSGTVPFQTTHYTVLGRKQNKLLLP